MSLPSTLVKCDLIVCEKVLAEKDNVHSIIRKAEIFLVPKFSDADNPVRVKISALASARFQPEDTSTYVVSFAVTDPSGTERTLPEKTISLASVQSKYPTAPRGFDIVLELAIAATEPGRYSLRFLLDGEEATKAWFHIHQRQPDTAE